MKPIVLSFCSPVNQHKTNIFLHISDNEPMKTFGSGQSSIASEHKTKDLCRVEALLNINVCSFVSQVS